MSMMRKAFIQGQICDESPKQDASPWAPSLCRYMRNPVLPVQNGVPRLSGGKLLPELRLQVFSGREFDALGSLDLDLLAGLRVDAHPGLAVCNLECAEADELHRFAFF